MTKYKKFILFEIECYYPSGGLYDIRDSYDTLDKAIEYAKDNESEWKIYYVADRDTWEKVWEE